VNTTVYNITFISGQPPGAHQSDPVSVVSIEPVSELAVERRTCSVGENSQRSTAKQTLVTCIEPRQFNVKLSVALGVHCQLASITART